MNNSSLFAVERKSVRDVDEFSDRFKNIQRRNVMPDTNLAQRDVGRFHISESSLIPFTIDDVIPGPRKTNTKEHNKVNGSFKVLTTDKVNMTPSSQVSKNVQSSTIIQFTSDDSILRKPSQPKETLKSLKGFFIGSDDSRTTELSPMSTQKSKTASQPNIAVNSPDVLELENFQGFFQPQNVFPSEEVINLVGSTQVSKRPVRKALPQHLHHGR